MIPSVVTSEGGIAQTSVVSATLGLQGPHTDLRVEVEADWKAVPKKVKVL